MALEAVITARPRPPPSRPRGSCRARSRRPRRGPPRPARRRRRSSSPAGERCCARRWTAGSAARSLRGRRSTRAGRAGCCVRRSNRSPASPLSPCPEKCTSSTSSARASANRSSIALLHVVGRLVADDPHLEVADPRISEHGRQLLGVRGGRDSRRRPGCSYSSMATIERPSPPRHRQVLSWSGACRLAKRSISRCCSAAEAWESSSTSPPSSSRTVAPGPASGPATPRRRRAPTRAPAPTYPG